jgi:hypothetical protein
MPADVDTAISVLIFALLALYALVALPVVRSLELRLFMTLFDWFVPDRGDGRASCTGEPGDAAATAQDGRPPGPDLPSAA